MPTFGQLLLLGVGLEARVGLANWDVVDDVFSPPEVSQAPRCAHTIPCLFPSPRTASPPSPCARGKSSCGTGRTRWRW